MNIIEKSSPSSPLAAPCRDSELWVISGATASGKSDLALELADKIGGEIISADSMQLYREFSIGVAKPSAAEQSRIKHHLIDVASFHDRMDVYRYLEMAEKALNEVCSRERIPIICGGTGFYIKSLLYGLDDLPGDDRLREKIDRMSDDELFQLAEATDREAFAKWQNCRRKLVRALEVKIITGKSLLELQQHSFCLRYSGVKHFTLDREPDDLKNRIRLRAGKMLSSGWIEEAEYCLKNGLLKSPTAHQAIGYRLIGDYLAGRYTLTELTDKIAVSTWQYARRQRTWFGNQHPEAVHIKAVPGEKAALSAILSFTA